MKGVWCENETKRPFCVVGVGFDVRKKDEQKLINKKRKEKKRRQGQRFCFLGNQSVFHIVEPLDHSLNGPSIRSLASIFSSSSIKVLLAPSLDQIPVVSQPRRKESQSVLVLFGGGDDDDRVGPVGWSTERPASRPSRTRPCPRKPQSKSLRATSGKLDSQRMDKLNFIVLPTTICPTCNKKGEGKMMRMLTKRRKRNTGTQRTKERRKKERQKKNGKEKEKKMLLRR